ncbi:MAG TPA: hypothetical protein VM782_17740 [Stellaceae bacterium]|nr:hypothetical protein [Stellaceae bacterium]
MAVAAQAQTTAPAVVPGSSATLPEVVVRPPTQDPQSYDPYTSGIAGRPSSMNHIYTQHYRVPVGYDADVAMHPYTSNIGPCPEGAAPSQGCSHPTGTPIQPSHYDHAPFTR